MCIVKYFLDRNCKHKVQFKILYNVLSKGMDATADDEKKYILNLYYLLFPTMLI